MEEHKAVVKAHYDKHVKHIATEEALLQRKLGIAKPLKDFHNQIKRRLIYRFAHGAEKLLDLACGRGGDINKWDSAKIQYVKGIDLSPAEVHEAQRRYLDHLAKGCETHCEFEQSDHLGDAELVDPAAPYDVATCMFSIHYFFERREMLQALLANVASNLKPGGYLLGTVPDGKRVAAFLKDRTEFISPVLKLYRRWEGGVQPFGSTYVMEIADTVVEGHGGESKGSPEFLVFAKALLGEAAAAGLYPVLQFEDDSLTSMFEEADAAAPVKHFRPQYPPGTDEGLEAASKINMAFVLQRVATAADAVAPPLPPPPSAASQRRPPHRNGRAPRDAPSGYGAPHGSYAGGEVAAPGGWGAPAGDAGGGGWVPPQHFGGARGGHGGPHGGGGMDMAAALPPQQGPWQQPGGQWQQHQQPGGWQRHGLGHGQHGGAHQGAARRLYRGPPPTAYENSKIPDTVSWEEVQRLRPGRFWITLPPPPPHKGAESVDYSSALPQPPEPPPRQQQQQQAATAPSGGAKVGDRPAPAQPRGGKGAAAGGGGAQGSTAGGKQAGGGAWAGKRAAADALDGSAAIKRQAKLAGGGGAGGGGAPSAGGRPAHDPVGYGVGLTPRVFAGDEADTLAQEGPRYVDE